MVLSDEDILKFQALYKSEFGIEINREDARDEGIKLLRLLSIVLKPKTEEGELNKEKPEDTLPLPEPPLPNL